MIRTVVILFFFLAPIISTAQQQSLVYQFRFGTNKHTLSAEHQQLLSHIYDTLAGVKNYIIYVNGHADSDADSSYNQQLSLKRSLAVKSFLVEKGMQDSLFSVQALGEAQPLVANTTPMDKAKNRRVELVVLFMQEPKEEVIEVKKDTTVPGCVGDTTVTLEGGYTLIVSKCDWERNSQCLRVEKKLRYKIHVKENWLKKHIGFKNYKKYITYEPHYEFYVVSCMDSCFKQPVKLYIPHYQAPGLVTGVPWSQKKNDKNNIAKLSFKKTKLGDSAYYVAEIYCPGSFRCGTDNRCSHDVSLYAKNNISILSYSYYERSRSSYFDSVVKATPSSPEKLTDNYRNAFFHTLTFMYKGDTATLKDIPIDIFAHGRRKIKLEGYVSERGYFLFIPYQKKYKCGHYKKYKLRSKDIPKLMEFYIGDLEMEK